MALHDDKLAFRTATTAVTATTNTASVRVPQGLRNVLLYAEIEYWDAANSSGSNTVTFETQHSSDDSTYYTLSSGAHEVVNLNTTNKKKRFFLPVETANEYLRITATLAGAGSGSTFKFNGWLVEKPV